MKTDMMPRYLHLDDVKSQLQDVQLRWRSSKTNKIILIAAFLAFSLVDIVHRSFIGIELFFCIFAICSFVNLTFTFGMLQIIRIASQRTGVKFSKPRQEMSVLSAVPEMFVNFNRKRETTSNADIAIDSLISAFVLFCALDIGDPVVPSIMSIATTIVMLILMGNLMKETLAVVVGLEYHVNVKVELPSKETLENPSSVCCDTEAKEKHDSKMEAFNIGEKNFGNNYDDNRTHNETPNEAAGVHKSERFTYDGEQEPNQELHKHYNKKELGKQSELQENSTSERRSSLTEKPVEKEFQELYPKVVEEFSKKWSEIDEMRREHLAAQDAHERHLEAGVTEYFPKPDDFQKGIPGSEDHKGFREVVEIWKELPVAEDFHKEFVGVAEAQKDLRKAEAVCVELPVSDDFQKELSDAKDFRKVDEVREKLLVSDDFQKELSDVKDFQKVDEVRGKLSVLDDFQEQPSDVFDFQKELPDTFDFQKELSEAEDFRKVYQGAEEVLKEFPEARVREELPLAVGFQKSLKAFPGAENIDEDIQDAKVCEQLPVTEDFQVEFAEAEDLQKNVLDHGNQKNVLDHGDENMDVDEVHEQHAGEEQEFYRRLFIEKHVKNTYDSENAHRTNEFLNTREENLMYEVFRKNHDESLQENEKPHEVKLDDHDAVEENVHEDQSRKDGKHRENETGLTTAETQRDAGHELQKSKSSTRKVQSFAEILINKHKTAPYKNNGHTEKSDANEFVLYEETERNQHQEEIKQKDECHEHTQGSFETSDFSNHSIPERQAEYAESEPEKSKSKDRAKERSYSEGKSEGKVKDFIYLSNTGIDDTNMKSGESGGPQDTSAKCPVEVFPDFVNHRRTEADQTEISSYKGNNLHPQVHENDKTLCGGNFLCTGTETLNENPLELPPYNRTVIEQSCSAIKMVNAAGKLADNTFLATVTNSKKLDPADQKTLSSPSEDQEFSSTPFEDQKEGMQSTPREDPKTDEENPAFEESCSGANNKKRRFGSTAGSGRSSIIPKIVHAPSEDASRDPRSRHYVSEFSPFKLKDADFEFESQLHTGSSMLLELRSVLHVNEFEHTRSLERNFIFKTY